MAAQKKKTGKKAAPPPQKQARPVRREVGGFVCLLLALCVLVSYFGVQAFFLTLLEKLLKGLTGYGYWLWAAALAVVGVVLVGHGAGARCAWRVTGTLAIPVLSGSLLHLLLCRVAYAPGAIGLPSLRDLWVDGLSLRGGGRALRRTCQALLEAGFSSVVAGSAAWRCCWRGPVLLMHAQDAAGGGAAGARERRESARLAHAEDEEARLLEEEESPAVLPRRSVHADGAPSTSRSTSRRSAAGQGRNAAGGADGERAVQLAPKRKLFSRRGEDVRTPDEVLRPQAEPAPAPEPAPAAQETGGARPQPDPPRRGRTRPRMSVRRRGGRPRHRGRAGRAGGRIPLSAHHAARREPHGELRRGGRGAARGNSRRLAQTLQSFGVDAQAGRGRPRPERHAL